MEYNFYDCCNMLICIIAVFYICFKYSLSNKVLWLLLLHVALVFFMDAIFNYSYWGDQYRYVAAATQFRNQYSSGEFGSVMYASLFFSLFPLFIESIKSIAFINFMLYLLLFVYLLHLYRTNEIMRRFKMVYLLYPSLILFTSLGLRDFLITSFMFLSLYNLLVTHSKIKTILFMSPLYFIKAQNLFLLGLTVIFAWILRVKNMGVKVVLFSLLFWSVIIWVRINLDMLLKLRSAMFLEDTGLNPILSMNDWSYQDLYRILFAPLFFDARNAMQLIQSVENLGLGVVIYKFIQLARKVKIPRFEFIVLNFFAIVSTLLYSLVVFNYGTVTRYKMPFVFCWMLMVLLMIDKKIYSDTLHCDIAESVN